MSICPRELQSMIHACQPWSIQINTEKTKIMAFFETLFLKIAFITGNSSLEPLIEGLCAQIHVNLS